MLFCIVDICIFYYCPFLRIFEKFILDILVQKTCLAIKHSIANCSLSNKFINWELESSGLP